MAAWGSCWEATAVAAALVIMLPACVHSTIQRQRDWFLSRPCPERSHSCALPASLRGTTMLPCWRSMSWTWRWPLTLIPRQSSEGSFVESHSIYIYCALLRYA
jgi:hypothetical protein